MIPISAFVTRAPLPSKLARRISWVTRAGPCATPEWSGQRIPTGAKVMQSSQIGRPHSEQETSVSRLGWR